MYVTCCMVQLTETQELMQMLKRFNVQCTKRDHLKKVADDLHQPSNIIADYRAPP